MQTEMERTQSQDATRGPGRQQRTRRAAGADPSLRELVRTLLAGRWIVAGTLAVALAAAAIYLLGAPRTYRATSLLEIADDSALARLDPLRPPPLERESRDNEIERLRSRRVIAPVVERLGLDVVARPRRFPVLGEALARRHAGSGLAKAPPLLGAYAWGGEAIAVSRLELPEALVGVPLTLVALEDGRYRVRDHRGAALAEGVVGTPAVPAGGRTAGIVVETLVARPGTEFRLEQLHRDDAVSALRSELTVVERGRRSRVLEATLEGRDPRRIAAVLSGIAAEFVAQAAAQRSGEIARTIELVKAQLRAVRTRLEAAEAATAGFKRQTGMVDLSLETKAVIDRVAELQKELSDVETERATMAGRHTDLYPEMITLGTKASAIRSALQALGARLKELPETELRARRLERDVSIATDQYAGTLNQIQALEVARHAETGNVRVLDAAVAARTPVSPRPAPVLVLALLLGSTAGVAGALVRGALAAGEDDAREIEDATGLATFATVPHSEVEARLHRDARGGPRATLAVAAPDDLATEGLRTLRTVLGFLVKAKGNVIAITSPAPGAGKTFVTANLGQLLAAAGKRVLVVDADLRRGALHRSFSIAARPGLSDVLAGGVAVEGAIRTSETAGLAVLPCGAAVSSPAELLASARLDETVAALSRRYDVVLLDTAPTLAATDAVLVGRCASLNLLVLRSRQHAVHEIAQTLERFARSGVQVHGAIVNDSTAGGRYARGYAPRLDVEGASAALR